MIYSFSEYDPLLLENLKVSCLLNAKDLLLLKGQKGLTMKNVLIVSTYILRNRSLISILRKLKQLFLISQGGNKILIVPIQYLGEIFTPSGPFNQQLYNKGLRVIFSLVKDFHPQFGTPVKILSKLASTSNYIVYL